MVLRIPVYRRGRRAAIDGTRNELFGLRLRTTVLRAVVQHVHAAPSAWHAASGVEREKARLSGSFALPVTCGRRDSAILQRLTGRIQIGILAHLALHFLALFFVIEQNLAIAEMAAFDLALRFVE